MIEAMRIVADENIPSVGEAFGELGSVETVAGRALTAERVRAADLLLVRSVTPVGRGLLEGSAVRFVASATAGIDHVDTDYLRERGIGFAHAPASNADAVAEYVAAVLLELAHRRRQKLSGMTLGVVGVGAVGGRVVRIGRALGMMVLQNDPPRAAATDTANFRPLDEVLAQSEAVTLHVPLATDGPHATLGMVNSDWLARLNPGAWFINTSRGEIADEAALLEFADNDPLAAIALDVWRDEPAVSADLLERVEIATPHIAGYSAAARLAGTRAVHEAVCRWLDRPPTWPPPVRGSVAIQIFAPSRRNLQSEVRSAVRHSCDVAAMSDAMKAQCAAGRPDRAAAFDRLRREFLRPNEFRDLRLSGAGDPALAEVLAQLGFGVIRSD